MKTVMPRVFDVKHMLMLRLLVRHIARNVRVSNLGVLTQALWGFSQSVLGNCGIETISSSTFPYSSFNQIHFRSPIDPDLLFHRKCNNPQIKANVPENRSIGSLAWAEGEFHSIYIFLFTNVFGHMSLTSLPLLDLAKTVVTKYSIQYLRSGFSHLSCLWRYMRRWYYC